MFRYPDGTFKVNPPAKVIFQGVYRKFQDLTREQWDEAGYNEAVQLRREAYTTYKTQWVKGEDLIYLEEVIEQTVDETAKTEHEASVKRTERDRKLAASDKTILELERKIRIATRNGEDAADLETKLDEWDAYRAALCDVPQQEAFPASVEWPVEPA